MKKVFAFLLSICMSFSMIFNVSAAIVSSNPMSEAAGASTFDTGSIVMDALVDQFGFVVDRAQVPEDATVLITLSASNSSTVGVINVYTRQTRGDTDTKLWVKELESAAAYGENGIYKTLEGDKKTPVGTFKMNTPFGINARGEGFPENYLQVDAGHYWDGDPKSALYNQLVHTSSYNNFDRSKSEHLIDYTVRYNYAINIGYNPECTAYLGSAIFLHCYMPGDPDTSGCVAVPESEMIKIMQLYEEGKTWMVIYDVENPQGVY